MFGGYCSRGKTREQNGLPPFHRATPWSKYAVFYSAMQFRLIAHRFHHRFFRVLPFPRNSLYKSLTRLRYRRDIAFAPLKNGPAAGKHCTCITILTQLRAAVPQTIFA
jgi:hypothetical protein